MLKLHATKHPMPAPHNDDTSNTSCLEVQEALFLALAIPLGPFFPAEGPETNEFRRSYPKLFHLVRYSPNIIDLKVLY